MTTPDCTAVPADFSLSDGRILSVRKGSTGHYYVKVGSDALLARVDRLETARAVFFALAVYDTDVAVFRAGARA